jgi:glycine/D-amino acid oxidase-like deaminating enzyme
VLGGYRKEWYDLADMLYCFPGLRGSLYIIGGHTKAASYHTFLDHAASHGLPEAVKIARLEYNTIKAIQAFVREKNIDCDLFSGDTVDIFYDLDQWEKCQAAITAMRSAMPEDLDGAAKYEFLSAEDANTRFHVRGKECVGAVTYEAGSLSAYRFVIAILKLCLGMGVELYTNTPATNIERLDDSWRVHTNRGTIEARRVVLATNGYTAFLDPRFQNVIVPLRGQITAHRPGKSMPEEGLQTTYSFVYAGGFDYMIPRPKGSKYAGDIVIGGGLTKGANGGVEEFGTVDDSKMSTEISEYLTDTTPRIFGSSWGEDDDEGRVRKQWTGIMGYSNDGYPYIGEVTGGKGLWIAASFQGHGMVMCFLCAKALVGMMSGDDESLNPWFPVSFRLSEERMKKKFTGL